MKVRDHKKELPFAIKRLEVLFFMRFVFDH